MKDFDEIERLFSSTFEGAEITPDSSVKKAIDTSLFGSSKNLFYKYLILFLVLVSGSAIAYYSISIEPKLKQQITEGLDEVKEVDTQFNRVVQDDTEGKGEDARANNLTSNEHKINKAVNSSKIDNDSFKEEIVEIEKKRTYYQ